MSSAANTVINESIGGILYFFILLIIIIFAGGFFVGVVYGLYTLYQRYKLSRKVYTVPDTLSTSIELDETNVLSKGKKKHVTAFSIALYRRFLLPLEYKPTHFSWPTLYFYNIERSANLGMNCTEKKSSRSLKALSCTRHHANTYIEYRLYACVYN